MPVHRKPALGIMPKRCWDEQRVLNLNATITRYCDADMEIPVEWIKERNQLIRVLRGVRNED